MAEGTDSTCQSELNRQIQGLQARVSQAENNITAHYVGISTLVAALAETPAEAAAEVAMPFYNMIEGGFATLQGMVSLVDPKAFKTLMMEMAGGLIAGMAAELEDVAAGVAASVNGAIETLTATIAGLEEALAHPEGLSPEEIAALTAQLSAAVADLQAKADLLATSGSFLTAQKNAAQCKSRALILTT